MYASRDEARSDLLLAAAAYLFGPLFVGLLLTAVPLERLPGVAQVLRIVLPLVYTLLVPLLLIRYRKESLRAYGFGDGRDPSTLVGLLAALPVVVASVLVALLAHGDPLAALPMFPGGAFPLALAGVSPVLVTIERLAQWVGVLLLALYVAVKARDAFGSTPIATADAVRKVSRVVAVGGAVATLLLVIVALGRFDLARLVAILLGPVAVAAAVGITIKRLGLAGSTLLGAIVVPVVVLAVQPLRGILTFDLVRLLSAVYGGALSAGFGMIVALMVDRTRRGLGVLMLGIVIATLTMLGPFGFAV